MTMLGPTLSSGPLGGTTTYVFSPEFNLDDVGVIQKLLDDATALGVVALKFRSDREVRVVITTSADLRV